MSASTRIFLAVTAAIVVVLVVYYGVFSGEFSGPQTVRAAEEANQPNKPGQSVSPRERTEAPPRVDPQSLITAPQPMPEAKEAAQEEEPTETAEEPAEGTLEDLAPVDMEAAEETVGDKGNPPPTVQKDDETEESENDADGEDSAEPEEESDEERPEQPAPAPPGAGPGAPQYTDYTVKANDTMSSIAEQRFGDASKWDLIAKANPLVDPARLQVGQVLRLPPKDAQREEPEERAGGSGGPIEYTVRSGDTLSRIARTYYGHERHWQRIYDANRETIGDSPNNLRVGMKLTIPPAPSE